MIKSRESNIELLRIIAFLMVVFIHVSTVGLYIPHGITHSTKLSWYYSTIIRCITNPAISLYILISGYLLSKKNEINVCKNLKRLFIPLLIYLPFFVYAYIDLYSKTNINPASQIFVDFITLSGMFHHLWYIFAYTFIIFISPIVLNAITSVDRKKIKIILILCALFIGVSNIIGCLFNIGILKGMFDNNVLYLMIMYMIGLYIGTYNVKYPKKVLIILILLCFSINYYIFYCQNNNMSGYLNLSMIANNFCITNIIASICIFLFFKDISFNNKIINKIAINTYGAFIIHTFYILYLQRILPFTNYVRYNNYFIYDILFVLLVSTCSILTEKARNVLVDLFSTHKIRK